MAILQGDHQPLQRTQQAQAQEHADALAPFEKSSDDPSERSEGICIYLDGMSEALHGNAATARRGRARRRSRQPDRISPKRLARVKVDGQRVAAVLAPSMRPVVNLSGTVIHTNLGRALLADDAAIRYEPYPSLTWPMASPMPRLAPVMKSVLPLRVVITKLLFASESSERYPTRPRRAQEIASFIRKRRALAG